MKGALIFVLLLAGCGSTIKLPVQEGFLWMEGNWVGESGGFGENWYYYPAEDRLEGIGWKVNGGDTVQTEIMQLLFRREKLFYMADTGNQPPVYFEVTETSPGHFVAENPYHDFPKKIVYSKQGEDLKARISGDGKSMDFTFHPDY